MKLIEYIKPYFKNNDKLQVLFFFDPDRSREKEIEELKETDKDILIKVCKEDWFSQKVWLQQNKDVSVKMLYYPGQKRPFSQEEKENFGMMGELLANEELQIDDAAVIIQELNLKVSMKPLITKYLSELNDAKIRSSLKGLFMQDEVSEKDLQRGIIGGILNARSMEDWTSVMMRLVDFSLDKFAVKWNEKYKRIQKANLADALNDKIKVYFGTVLKTGSHEELRELALRVKYNLITQGIEVNETDPYYTYKIKDASALLNLEQIRKSFYNKSRVSAFFIEAMQKNGENIKESKIVECYGYNIIYSHYNDALRLCLLSSILSDYLKEGKDVKDALLLLDQHTSDDNYFKYAVNFLLNAIGLSELMSSCRSFNFDNNPYTFIEKYVGKDTSTDHYSNIDFLYRKSLYHFYKKDDYTENQVSKDLCEELNENLIKLKREVDAKYLSVVYDLNFSWMKSLKSYNFDYKKIKEDNGKYFHLQYDFFDDYISKETSKIAVIISDGLRYEVAEELSGILQKNKNFVKNEITWSLASVPSTTLFGMANLLPCNTGKYLGKKGIELDGISTNGMNNRAMILESSQKSAGRTTMAVSAQDILKNNAKDNREIFKTNIVYVYHDQIDSMAHSKGHEYHAVDGSETAVSDLAKLVSKIINSNVTKIIITADHGFLYRDSKIEEQDKIDWPGMGSAVEQGARHTVVKNHIPSLEQGLSFDLKNTTKYKDDYQVHTPVSTNRLKGRGVTYEYTHGGASLQELVVPVITISSLTEKQTRNKQKVGIQLIGNKWSVKSNVLKDIQLLQLNSISDSYLKRTVEAGLYEDKKLVSNIKKLEFNMTGKSPSERMLTTSLTLQMKTSGSLLNLRVYDVEDKLNPLIDVSVKNNTLIERDFDF